MLIRKGSIEVVEDAFDLLLELARFENAEDKVTNSVTRMKEEGFGPSVVSNVKWHLLSLTPQSSRSIGTGSKRETVRCVPL